MKQQFYKGVYKTPQLKVGDYVWWISENISTTSPISQLDCWWLGPFTICQQVSRSSFHMNLPLSMKGVHPAFHISVIPKNKPELHQKSDKNQHLRTSKSMVRNNGKWKTSFISGDRTTTSNTLLAVKIWD